MSTSLLAAQRRTLIRARLTVDQNLSVRRLAADLGVSPGTVRRDLRALDRAGLVVRVHGGALSRSHLACPTPLAATPVADDVVAAVLAGCARARLVAVPAGECCRPLCAALLAAGNDVVTNALDVAPGDASGLTLLPGVLHGARTVVGPPAVAAAAALRGHVLVTETRSLDGGSVHAADPLLGEVAGALAAGAEQVIVVVRDSGPSTAWPAFPLSERVTLLPVSREPRRPGLGSSRPDILSQSA